MDWQRLPSCCGATIIEGFDDDYGMEKKIKREIALVVRKIKEWNRKYRKGFSHMIMATTNENQTDAADALEKLGFKMVEEWKNASSGNRVRFYYKIIKIG